MSGRYSTTLLARLVDVLYTPYPILFLSRLVLFHELIAHTRMHGEDILDSGPVKAHPVEEEVLKG